MVDNHLPIGSPMTTYFNEGYTQQNIDVECAFIIPNFDAVKSITPKAPIEVRQLPAVPQTAVTIVIDDFYKQVAGLTPAYNALGQWVEANGYKIVGPPRELLHGSPHTNDLTAEIQFPVEKA